MIRSQFEQMKNEFGHLLVEIRMRYNSMLGPGETPLTQRNVAECINLSPLTLHNVERAHRSTLHTILKVYSFYGYLGILTPDDKIRFRTIMPLNFGADDVEPGSEGDS